MLRDATYTGVTPAFWGLARRRRRARRVADVRPDELRQGPARPARARLARRRRRHGFATSRSACARERASSSPTAPSRAAAATASRRSSRSSAPGSRASRRPRCTSRRSSTTRRSPCASSATAASGCVTHEPDRRRGRAAEAAGRAEEAADLAQPIPASPDSRRRRTIPEVEGCDEETAALTPEGLAERAWTAIGAAPEIGMYGYVTSGVTELGDRLDDRSRGDADDSPTRPSSPSPATRDVSGYADATAWRRRRPRPGRGRAGGGGDGGAHARSRRDRARRPTAPCSSPTPSPSSSPTSASAPWTRSPCSRAAATVSGRIGEQLFSDGFTICDDGLDPAGYAEGVRLRGRRPSSRSLIVEEGVARDVVWDRRTAARDGARVDRARASGAGAGARAGSPSTSSSTGGDAARWTSWPSCVGDGIYVTRLHYLNIGRRARGDHTGMTRDGTFRIEDGSVTTAARQPALHDVVPRALRRSPRADRAR